jgi:hypothetical protein
MAAAIGAIFKEAAVATGVGVASLTMAAGKSLEVAGKTSAKAVEVTGVVAEKSLNVTKKGVEVGANVTMAGLTTAGKVSTAALETTAVATQAAAKITQAAANSTANASAATLKASANIVKSGVEATSKIANAALEGTTQVTTDTLKGSADAASAAAKFSLGSVTTALKGLDNLRDLGSMKGQNWVNKVRNKTVQGRKITNLKQPQFIIELLEQEYNTVVKDLRLSFENTLDSNKLALDVLLVNIKDLYCMSKWRRLTKSTCPRNVSTLRESLERKMKLQSEELDSKVKFFFTMFDARKNETMSQFKTESQRLISQISDAEAKVDAIKQLFTKKLDSFSGSVAQQLTKLTTQFEERSRQYTTIIENAYNGKYAMNGVFNAPIGGTRKRKQTQRKQKKTRKH